MEHQGNLANKIDVIKVNRIFLLENNITMAKPDFKLNSKFKINSFLLDSILGEKYPRFASIKTKNSATLEIGGI